MAPDLLQSLILLGWYGFCLYFCEEQPAEGLVPKYGKIAIGGGGVCSHGPAQTGASNAKPVATTRTEVVPTLA